MRRAYGCAAGAVLAMLSSGCGLLSPSSVTVNLVNNGDFAVEVQIFVHSDQNVLETLIDDVGEELNFSVPAGSTVTFARDCDDLQAIIIEDADLQILGGLITPDANTEVLRDGSDFGCGDTLTFTFTHPDLALSLNIAFAAR